MFGRLPRLGGAFALVCLLTFVPADPQSSDSASCQAAPPAASKPESPAPTSGGDARLKGADLDGHLHYFGEAEGVRTIVVVFLSTSCPISNGCLPELNQLLTPKKPRTLEVFGVLSDPDVSRAKALRFREEYGLRFPLLFDASEELRSSLKPTRTPEAFVLSRDGAVMYRGAIDNRYASVGKKKVEATEHYVRDAVTAVTAGKRVAVASTPAVGCVLEEPLDRTKAGSVTFNRDIAPILNANCVRCHREGQAGPFPLATYEDAVGHAKQIVAVTKSKQMPPWKPTPGFGRFKDELRLNDREISLLASWADNGRPRGEEDDLPAAPQFIEGWQLGKPDVVLKVPKPFEVPAAGEDLHQHFVLPVGGSDTRLISAVEFRPGNPKVVHHACFYMDNTGTGRKLDQSDPGPGYGGPGGALFPVQGTLRSWLPGINPRRLPEGTGRVMLKGSDLILELHYQSSGKVEFDQSTVALYYAPKSARRLVGEIQVLNYMLDIPPGVARHKHSASYTLAADATLLDCAPHMHLLGREMKAVATLPDGRVEPLIWIKDWHYLWQAQYEYLEPVRLPKGTRIDVDAWYDNTPGNPLNPFSPPQRVTWGEQTKEEMGICHFQYTCDRMQDYAEFSRHYDRYRSDQANTVRASRSAPNVTPTAPAAK